MYEALQLMADYEDWNKADTRLLADNDLKAAEETCRLAEPMAKLE
jgi:hypothetical protein